MGIALTYEDPSKLQSPDEIERAVFEISNEAYHGGPGISKSMLDKVEKSPAHYWHAYLNPEAPPRQRKDHFDLGTAVHSLILEPDRFEEDVAIAPEVNRRTKAGRQEWDEFLQANSGKAVLTQEMYDVARRMADSALSVPMIRDLCSGGLVEKSFYWRDEETGLLCRVRPDYLRSDVLVDLKTTKSAVWHGFARSMADYRYYVQDAFYTHGVAQATAGGLQPEYMIFIAIEKEPPYLPGVFVLDKEARARGFREFGENLRTIRHCLKTGAWPGYSQGVQELSLPPWYERQKNEKPEEYEWVEAQPQEKADGFEPSAMDSLGFLTGA